MERLQGAGQSCGAGADALHLRTPRGAAPRRGTQGWSCTRCPSAAEPREPPATPRLQRAATGCNAPAASPGMMGGRRLLWVALCAVTLCGPAAGSPTDEPTTALTPRTGTSGSSAATSPSSTAEPARETTAAAGPPTPAPTSTAHSTGQPSPRPGQTSPRPPSTRPDTSSGPPAATHSPTAQPGTTAAPATSGSALPSSPTTPGHTATSAPAAPGGRARNASKPITCHQVKEVGDAGAICLHLPEAPSCKHFLEMKGSALWSAICEENAHRVPSPCQIKLAKSEVDRHCMLLILVGEGDPATDMLRESHWEKFGIKSLRRGSVRSHQDFSRKTLIALVTSGLLLAFLGLAGYFLAKRRSWSPVGERLQ
ncbi:hematopoietic progenitor cell antigen CD34 isoform X3 [Dromaius novaehollandiae]|uniref:hematopoietic progenitor cell antigen CD34 isoform X3 n=1 Tax=Dromaius novaehollandiae TaxID=8790 RepID=UPI00311F880A